MGLQLIEVGPRDGLQNQKTLVAVEDRFRFIELLVAAGHREIEMGAFVSPKAVPQMQASDQLYQKVAKAKWAEGIKFSALIPNERGLLTGLKLGMQSFALLTATSNSFNQKNINIDVETSMQRMRSLVKQAKKVKAFVRVYLSTAFACPYEGPVDPAVVVKMCKQLMELEIDEIAVSDTIGTARPHEVEALSEMLAKAIGLERVAYHFHNTRGTALANVWTAAKMGVQRFDASSGGLGGCPFAPGAAGNLASEDLLYAMQNSAFDFDIDLEKQVSASRFITEKLGCKVSSRYLESRSQNGK